MGKTIIIALAILLFLAGCASNIQTTGTSSHGYLRLSGSMYDRAAYVDGNLIGVDPEDDSNTVRLKTGSHLLEIRSPNRILLSESIEITEKCTTEITVP